MATRVSYPGAALWVPATSDLTELARGAEACEGCELFEPATQTVFGSGTADARLMLVGEQPGDVEDQRGEPFVGPAGNLLRRALGDAGLDDVPRWTTNAVKHFRFTERGKRRIHEKPSAAQSTACRPWLVAEVEAVRPAVLVALGATAGASLFGPGFRLTASRGAPVTWPPAKGVFADSAAELTAFATVHPSAVLRAPDDERDAAYASLVDDLRVVAKALA